MTSYSIVISKRAWRSFIVGRFYFSLTLHFYYYSLKHPVPECSDRKQTACDRKAWRRVEDPRKLEGAYARMPDKKRNACLSEKIKWLRGHA